MLLSLPNWSTYFISYWTAREGRVCWQLFNNDFLSPFWDADSFSPSTPSFAFALLLTGSAFAFFSEGFKKSDKQQPFLSRKSFFGRLRPSPSPDLDLCSFFSLPPQTEACGGEKSRLSRIWENLNLSRQRFFPYFFCEKGASIFAQVEKCIWSVFGPKKKLYFRVPRKECQNNVSLTPSRFPYLYCCIVTQIQLFIGCIGETVCAIPFRHPRQQQKAQPSFWAIPINLGASR